MYKLYDVVKYKTGITGYWLDNNKMYFDNINILNIANKHTLNVYKRVLFGNKKQETIFYIKDNIAYIEDKQGNITILKHCIRYKEQAIREKENITIQEVKYNVDNDLLRGLSLANI